MFALMTPVKRPIADKQTRSERARATRLRITKAAYTLFCERGYSGTTMADVADAAGVAVQTVYSFFFLPTSHVGNLAIWPPDQFQEGIDLDQAWLKE